MTSNVRRASLPIRRWLALALLIVFLVPVLVTVVFAVAWVREDPHDERAEAVQLLRENSDRWGDPEWRNSAAADLSRQGVAFILVEDGREIYRSTSDPFAGSSGEAEPRVVERVMLPGGEDSDTVAYVYGDQESGPPDEIPAELLPVVGIGALALTLTGIAWFVGRTVIQPLTATSQAARQVAEGDLEISLPSSRVREVSELNTAFETMSSELKASLAHRTEMERERRLFISAIAHDLRTPLFSLRGYLEGLAAGLASTPEKRDRYLSIAQDKAGDLEQLITDLFDYTRLEYLDQEPESESLDLAGLLQRSVEGIHAGAQAKGVEVKFDADGEDCSVEADSRLITRAVDNLLDNAIRHTPTGGSIRVACGSTVDGVVFSISDTGPGLSDEDLSNLFRPLYRGEASRNRQTGGAGLGLTIARRILRAHGGDLTADNNSNGGAVFTGSLPVTVGTSNGVNEAEGALRG